jgi:hypothetical protein
MFVPKLLQKAGRGGEAAPFFPLSAAKLGTKHHFSPNMVEFHFFPIMARKLLGSHF